MAKWLFGKAPEVNGTNTGGHKPKQTAVMCAEPVSS